MRARLAAALAACGQSPLRDPAAYRRLGAGAWHDAYRVTTADGRRLVVRLRKPVIYGRRERFDERALHTDYAGVGAYYAAANACQPGVCPAEYAYHIGPDLSCTVESYLGPTLALDRLTPGSAVAIGRAAGEFFRAMHEWRPPWPGWGELVWTPEGLRGEDPRPPAEIRAAEAAAWREGLARLVAAGYDFDHAAARAGLDRALAGRSAAPAPPSLVNGDITPENLIVRRGRFVGLIDPVPAIGDGARYAAFFLVCYRLLLPALHDAPRYARHHFDRHAPALAHIADGFAAGYLGGDPTLGEAVGREYFLWVLDLAVAAHAMLGQPVDEERRRRTGGQAAIARRVRGYVAALTHPPTPSLSQCWEREGEQAIR
ncbi:MAG TPA: phosphotransferase [Thermomicrobiales bacterium]|nr:phosphotransferase [Thermomicrobiales bacterium]